MNKQTNQTGIDEGKQKIHIRISSISIRLTLEILQINNGLQTHNHWNGQPQQREKSSAHMKINVFVICTFQS